MVLTGNVPITKTITIEPFAGMIGVHAIAKASDRNFSGSSPIKRYSTDGRRITLQAAMQAVSSRFTQEDTNMVSTAQSNKANQRYR